MKFFDSYPEFFRTSTSRATPFRLNARYEALIEAQLAHIRGKRVLDLASHDGRWSFAAIQAGAAFVRGVEPRGHLIRKAHRTFARYGVSARRYRFDRGDALSALKRLRAGAFDTVFCFGLLYHLYDHATFFREIRRLRPKTLILDTALVPVRETVAWISLEETLSDGCAVSSGLDEDKGHELIALPSRGLLELYLQRYGFRWNYYPWNKQGRRDWSELEDYEQGRRMTLVARL